MLFVFFSQLSVRRLQNLPELQPAVQSVPEHHLHLQLEQDVDPNHQPGWWVHLDKVRTIHRPASVDKSREKSDSGWEFRQEYVNAINGGHHNSLFSDCWVWRGGFLPLQSSHVFWRGQRQETRQFDLLEWWNVRRTGSLGWVCTEWAQIADNKIKLHITETIFCAAKYCSEDELPELITKGNRYYFEHNDDKPNKENEVATVNQESRQYGRTLRQVWMVL